jgi:fructose-1,6-bisphosphatase/inositol monophosphatase family enzyme
MAGVNDTTRGCLRTGSGAMNLAYLADGKFGGCWGHANKLWDVGAGLLLAELAGAKVSIREVDRSKHLVVTSLRCLPHGNFFTKRRVKFSS